MRPLLILGLAASLAACAGGSPPQIVTPPPELPQSFFFEPDRTTSEALDALLPIDDAAFLELASGALENAPSIAEALARVDAARAGDRRSGAERLPNIGADGNVTGNRTNPNQFGGNTPFSQFIDTEQVSYGANLTATWDADIFGRLRAQERAALARVDAANASAAAVRTALLAEIAGAVVDWRTLDARIEAISNDAAAASQLAQLARTREEAGIAPGFDRVRAEAAASGSRSRLAALESERVRIIGRLITLTGQSGAEVNAALQQGGPAFNPRRAPASMPSELLANRPDVIAAAAELAASDAELAAAARSRFPRLTLSGVLGLLAFNPGDLFDEDSLIGTLSAGIAAPLLDFGRLEAEIDGAAANKRVAFQAYRGAVYQALGDAEAAYGLIEASDREAALAAQEQRELERAASLANDRYRAGLASFLEVLEARRAADASGERAAAALGRAERARIILWQALGGGNFGASN
ncbi:efflux transporter outer membrane subunit [uncultured Erythrobacter sp.]|uniref:efflux transporter outer membrane subunit n=1 Tax=uncultured Erythrobacter sp. TaxID=263913 RepID=UPI00261B5DA6|nr:efflux transporter outer membrane subunit [uncultured Erythrobacter sp.]